jgi:glc operon protein GlcG
MSFSLAEALALADRAIAKAEELKISVSVAVVDEFGQLVQLDRMDGAALMSPDLAEAKAITALNFKRSTSDVAKLDSSARSAIESIVYFKPIALPGGLPIFSGRELRGAIGISGDDTIQDEMIAKFAIVS